LIFYYFDKANVNSMTAVIGNKGYTK